MIESLLEVAMPVEVPQHRKVAGLEQSSVIAADLSFPPLMHAEKLLGLSVPMPAH